MRITFRRLRVVLAAAALQLVCLPLLATTWYVRPDGGTRFSNSTNTPNGQCDGKEDVAYPGSGVNRHCAFNDVRLLWQDGTYPNGKPPSWGWVIAGGDTVIIRGSIGSGVSYRIGWPTATGCVDPALPEKQARARGICGDPYGSGMPPPPSGTPEHHTRILGENYQSCRADAAKTQLHGGHSVGHVMDMGGASYVDVACLDITDFSACGRATQTLSCDNQDFATNGIEWSNLSTHDSLTDVKVHGLAANGMHGPTGDGVTMDHIAILGNAASGWDADNGSGTTGVGSLTVTNYEISWNGCAEEYPHVHPIPYGDCTDQDHGGYGDGLGTATVDSPAPGWQVLFDHGVVSYNTQDGLDALHISGPGSSMTVRHTLAYGNMGQQIKVGGAAPTLTDNVIVGNCDAMKYDIPGTPPDFNKKLDLFCRAGDTAVVIFVPQLDPPVPAIYQRNIMYSANQVGLEVEYPNGPTSNAVMKYDHNIFVGFRGYENRYPSPIYSNSDLNFFLHKGASFDGNITYRPRDNWKCPATELRETNGSCSDPHLPDETWHKYGYPKLGPPAVQPGAGTPAGPKGGTGEQSMGSMPGVSRPVVAMSLIGAAAVATGTWLLVRNLRSQG
jgi:hypothetical protein